MTLEEAIAKYKESEKVNKELAKKCMTALSKAENRYKAEECRQIIEWLKELQDRRKQPEIIRCYECVHASDIVPIPNPNLRHCDKCGFFKLKDYFCGDAERRTDD